MPTHAALLAAVLALASTTEAKEDGRAVSLEYLDSTTELDPTLPSTSEAILTVADAVGVATNRKGDSASLFNSIILNSCIWLGCILAFSLLRLKFPMVYANNVLQDHVPSRLVPSNRPWGWVMPSLRMEVDEVFECHGLDAAMLLEFMHLCMRISALVGLPLIALMAPLYYHFKLQKPGADGVSLMEMGSVNAEHLWLHYVVASLVWLVVLITRKSVFNSQARFLRLRYRWLQSLPHPRATTILVENIPAWYQQDSQLRQYFESMFGPGSVQDAVVVKQHGHLLDLMMRWNAVKGKLHAANMRARKEGTTPQKVIKSVGPRMGQVVDAIPHYEEELRLLAPLIQKTRRSVWTAAQLQGGVNTSNGFVTFTRRREAEMAQDAQYGANLDEWNISVAPDPESVRWKDLRHQNRTVLLLRKVFGYACIAGVMFGYLFIVTTITNIARLVDAADLGMPRLQPLWEAFAPTLGLQLLVGFVPTLLVFIFRTCFVLKDDSWAQHKLQRWYFWIQVMYVILVACIGQSLADRMKQLVSSPLSFASLLADALPNTTHFYMNYLLLQCATNAANILRIANLIKYLCLCVVYPEEEARRMSEPENQDYFGIGARSARFTIDMLIGIIFSTISPPIAALSLVNFALCRLQYGYLIVFAEERKPDLGGVFWVTQLSHIQFGVMIYCCLMIGMLVETSAGGIGPTAIAASALLFTVWSYRRFGQVFHWLRLPLDKIDPEAAGDPEAGHDVGDPRRQAYVQPELHDDPDLEFYGPRSDDSLGRDLGERDSRGLAVMKTVSSGARRVGEMMKELGSAIDQAFLGAEGSIPTTRANSLGADRAESLQSTFEGIRAERSTQTEWAAWEDIIEHHISPEPEIPQPSIQREESAQRTRGAAPSTRAERQENIECYTSLPSEARRRSSAPPPPRMPSPPRGLGDEEADGGGAGAEALAEPPSCGSTPRYVEKDVSHWESLSTASSMI